MRIDARSLSDISDTASLLTAQLVKHLDALLLHRVTLVDLASSDARSDKTDIGTEVVLKITCGSEVESSCSPYVMLTALYHFYDSNITFRPDLLHDVLKALGSTARGRHDDGSAKISPWAPGG